MNRVSADVLAKHLAALVYSHLAHYKTTSRYKNPAEVLLAALKSDDLDTPIEEVLP